MPRFHYFPEIVSAPSPQIRTRPYQHRNTDGLPELTLASWNKGCELVRNDDPDSGHQRCVICDRTPRVAHYKLGEIADVPSETGPRCHLCCERCRETPEHWRMDGETKYVDVAVADVVPVRPIVQTTCEVSETVSRSY